MEMRYIAFIGLNERRVQACLSMLGIMANMAGVQWRASKPEKADVLMLDVSQQDQAPKDKPFIVVYERSEPKPNASYCLCHPFRAMPLIDLLQHIMEEHFSTVANETAITPANTINITSSSSFRQQLANLLMEETNRPGTIPILSDIGAVYVQPKHHSFYANRQLLRKLQAGSLHFHEFQQPIDNPPTGLIRQPLFLLGWFLANDPKMPLASWLTKENSFRLKRWPFINALPRDQQRLTICALLTRQALTYDAIKQLAKCSDHALTHFLNAAAFSGLLDNQPSSAVEIRMKPANSGRFGKLLRGLRNRLGLAS